MKSISILMFFAIMASSSALPTQAEKEHYNLNDAENLFEKYIKDYNKVYKDDADKKIHYEAFKKSLENINKLNADETNTATFGLNHLADLTPEEFKRMNGLKIPTAAQ